MTTTSQDSRRARLEALAEWARTLPDTDPDEAEARLVEVMGSEAQAGQLMRRVDDESRPGVPKSPAA